MNFSRNSLALSVSVFEGFIPFFYICIEALHAFLSLSLWPGLNAEQAEAGGVAVAKTGVIVFSSQLPSNDV